MTAMTAAEIARLRADHLRREQSPVPSLDDCLDAARVGQLFEIESDHEGHDGLVVDFDAAEGAHGVYAVLEAWARTRIGHAAPETWQAERIELVE